MPLSLASTGRCLKVVGVSGGTGCTRHLADMGIVPGAEIELVCRQQRGPILIDINGSRLAVGRGLAHRIMVKEE